MNKLFYKYLTPLLLLSVFPIVASGILIFILTMANFDSLQKKLVSEITIDLREEILAKNRAQASSEGKYIEEVINQIGSSLGVLSISPQFIKYDEQAISNYAENLMDENSPILEFSVVNEWGENFFTKRNPMSLLVLNTDELMPPLYDSLKYSRRPKVSEVMFVENTQQPYVMIGNPMFDFAGNFKGGVMAVLDLSFISTLLAEKSDKKSITYIVSEKGMLISHPSMFEVIQNIDYSKYDHIKEILGKSEGSIEREGMLYSYYTTKYGWKTIVEIPAREALASIENNKSTINAFIKITLNSISYAIAIIIILAIAVCIIVAIMVTNRTIQPIISLTQASKKISEGNFNLEIEKTSGDEIGQLTDSFNIMAKELSKKQEELVSTNKLIKQQADELLARYNSDLEQFAYVTTHDLIEPLRMITSYTQLLQRRYGNNLETDGKEYMGYVIEGVQRMHNIINDLFEYSHIRTNEKDFETVDLREALNDVLKKLQNEITASGAQVICGKLPVVKAVKSNMVQVFQNLIGNAIKFKHSEREMIIHINAEERGKEWVISVQDNGIGFDPKYSDKVFEIFKRLNKRNQFSGSGMGLAICKNIIERHGGKIWVEPKIEEGCTFYFSIRKG